MLKRVKALYDYTVRGTDDDVGKIHDIYFDSCNWEACYVVDFFVEPGNWMMRYLLVDTRDGLLSGKTVLIATDWITKASWSDKDVYYADLDRASIESSPEYDRSHPLSRDDEIVLHQHYHRQAYWTGAHV